MSRSPRPSDDWVRHARKLFPEIGPALDRAGVLDSTSYHEREGSLPARIRAEMGRIRHDLTLISSCEIRDQARAAPPWISPRALSDIRIPARILDALAPMGVILVSDLERFSDRDLLQAPGVTRAGLRTLSLGLLLANRTPPPRAVREERHPERLRNLLAGAPDPILALPVDHLNRLRPRPIRSLHEAGMRTLKDLQRVTDRQLLAMPGMGPGSLDDLVRSVQEALEGTAQDAALTRTEAVL